MRAVLDMYIEHTFAMLSDNAYILSIHKHISLLICKTMLWSMFCFLYLKNGRPCKYMYM